MGRDPHHVLVLEAALVSDCPCRRDSASIFSPGTNPSAPSRLKIPFQALKITLLFFFCSSAGYLPQVFPCRQGYGAQETIFLLNKTKKMHGNSSSSSQGSQWLPLHHVHFTCLYPWAIKTPSLEEL